MRIVLLALLISSCGVSTEESKFMSRSLPGSTVESDVAEQLIGRYALRAEVASAQTLPIIGFVTTKAVLYKLADVIPSGEGLAIRERTCELKFDDSNLIRLNIKQEAIRAIPETISELRAWEENGVIRFAKDQGVTLIGAKLDDELSDQLPTRANDPRVFDLDGNGKPGITASISALLVSGDIHYVQRSVTSYAGTVSSDGTLLSGLLVDRSEQNIIEASNFLLRTVGSIVTEPHPDESLSNLVLVRTSEQAACSDIDWDTIPLYKNL